MEWAPTAAAGAPASPDQAPAQPARPGRWRPTSPPPSLGSMWSLWMFTVPALRARECTPAEKDALNILFLAIPVLNVTIPLAVKSFALVWVADAVLCAGVWAWKVRRGRW